MERDWGRLVMLVGVGAACDVGWGGEVVMLCFWLIVVMTGCG